MGLPGMGGEQESPQPWWGVGVSQEEPEDSCESYKAAGSEVIQALSHWHPPIHRHGKDGETEVPGEEGTPRET